MAWIAIGTMIALVLAGLIIYQASRIFAREDNTLADNKRVALIETKQAHIISPTPIPPTATITPTATHTPAISPTPSATITETEIGILSTSTPSTPPEQLIANARYRLNMYTGPSTTYPHVGVLATSNPIQIIERNRSGTWVRVRELESNRDTLLEGWVVSGYIAFHPAFRYDRVPQNPTLNDSISDNIRSQLEAQLHDIPVLSEVSPEMASVYALGQSLGNHSNVATRVGDSIISNRYYLQLMSNPEDTPRLGPYADLQDTLNYFGPNMSESHSAIIGLSSVSVFDPMWTESDACESGESPMACEYRVHRPSVAFILFGHNDVRGLTGDEYRQNLSRIVEESMAQGVIPVLMTFSSHPDASFYQQTLEFNLIIAEVADTYHVPLMNLWLASRILPEYGLEVDRIHLRNSGFTYMKYDNGEEARSGVALLNLLSLRMLDDLRLTLGMDTP